jgi:hypothetical protein
MIANRPYIIYSLPKSRPTQALIGRRIRKAFDNASSFIENCTTAKTNQPDSLRLTAYSAFWEDESTRYSEDLINNTTKKFGEGLGKPSGLVYPSEQSHEQKIIEWNLNPTDLYHAIEFLDQNAPFPKFNLGPIELIIIYNFKLIDLLSNTELPDQQQTSNILIWLSRSNCCIMTLCFPFESADKRFYDYLNRLTPFLPCKLEQKYLRLVQPNKNNILNKFTKIK